MGFDRDKDGFATDRSYLKWLAERNRTILLKYLDIILVNNMRFRRATKFDCWRAHRVIEEKMFKHRNKVMLPEYFSDGRFRKILDKLVRSVLLKRGSLVNSTISQGIVPVLVRPEMFYKYRDVELFLESRRFEVVAKFFGSINLLQYMVLYEHAFEDPLREPHVRRRAFGYMNKPVCLLLVRRRFCSFSETADFLVGKLKGCAGIYEKGTIRGDLIFQEVSRIIEEGCPEELFALDPLMEYEYDDGSLYRKKIESKLHANIHGVHIPEAHEVRKDLAVLL